MSQTKLPVEGVQSEEDDISQLKLIMQKRVAETKRLQAAHDAEIKNLKLQLESNVAALSKKFDEELSALCDPETLFVWMAKYTSPQGRCYVQMFLSQIEAYKRKKERAAIRYQTPKGTHLQLSFSSVDFLSYKDLPQKQMEWIDDGIQHRLAIDYGTEQRLDE